MTIDRLTGYAATGLAGLALLGLTALALPDPPAAPATTDAAVLDTGAAAWIGGPDTDISDTLSGSWLLGDPVSTAITLPAPPTVPGPSLEATVLDAGTGASTPAGGANSALNSLVSSFTKLPMMAVRLLGSSAKEFTQMPSALEHDLHDATAPTGEPDAAAPTSDQLFTADPTLGGVLSGGGAADGLNGLSLDGLSLDAGALDAAPVDVPAVDVPADLIPLP